MADIVPIKTAGSLGLIEPKDFEEVQRFARMVIESGMAGGLKNVAAVMMVIIAGREMGLTAMQAIQRITCINGRLSAWGDAIPSMLWANGFKLVEKPLYASGSVSEINGYECTVIRPDGTEIKRKFTRAMAKTAKLWGKPGPWTQYPDRMLQMRARGLAARDGAADVLAGMYLAEEAQDIPVEGGELTANEQTPTKPTKADTRPTFEMIVEHFRGAVDRKTLNTIVCDYDDEIEQLKSAGWFDHVVEAYHEAFFRLADDNAPNLFEEADDVDS